MVLLVDTNVLIDYLGHRNGFEKAAHAIIAYCAREDVQGFVAFHSLPNIWYALRKEPEECRRKGLRAICRVFTVTGASHDEVVRAINQTDFKDFEDCLQDRCAVEVNADYIITRNVKDFATSCTEAITPSDFVKQYMESGGKIE